MYAAEYEANPAYFGVVVGRVANRIHHGKFSLDGTECQLTVNAPPNHLHGGLHGFSKVCYHIIVILLNFSVFYYFDIIFRPNCCCVSLKIF